MSMFLQLMRANASLPYKRRLDYLRSAGDGGNQGAFIDTGVLANPAYTLEVDFRYSGNVNATCGLAGGGQSMTQDGFNIFYQPSQQKLAFNFGNVDTNWVFDLTPGIRHKAKISNGKVYLDDVLLRTIESPVIAATRTIYLFRVNRESAQYQGDLTIYSARILDANGNPVRDFIPVLDLTGVPCMYDQVTGQFFYNAGTGEFVPSLYPTDDPTQKYVTDGIVCMFDSIKNSASGSSAELPR